MLLIIFPFFFSFSGEDDFDLWVTYTSIYSVLIYWLLGGFYMFIDITLKLRRFKVQPGTNEPINVWRYIKAIALVLFNQIFVSIPMIYGGFYVAKNRLPSARTLPTLQWITFEMIVLTLVREFTFYYSHRLLHTRFLYKTIHKMHHGWTSPMAITAAYCHPIEHIFSNVLPIGLGIGIMQSHILINWIWIGYSNLQTLTAHSGYHLPFLMSPEAHDFHHAKYVVNFDNKLFKFLI
jgi:fatty acid hydroxylase domain-containing protein 2